MNRGLWYGVDGATVESWMEQLSKYGHGEFLLTAAPLTVEGRTGAPLNPIATF